ncbi:phosphoglycerate mutase-like protein 1 [Quercus suber]|uniref:Phosphoglycerate mutase-like protein 1 n=1 Tax=Quercus suber TaxID=58331 RepID=A0AAW0M1V3_QUESU
MSMTIIYSTPTTASSSALNSSFVSLPATLTSISKLRPSSPLHRPLRLRTTLPPPILCSSSSLSSFGLIKPCIKVRHAQGIHNVEGEKDHDALLSYDLFDANLTPLGWKQVDNLRKHVHACGLSKRIDLVVVSPLLRAMQTAVGVFGGEAYRDGINVPPLMAANTGKSGCPAISSLNSPPFVAVELCRERLIENDDDILWTPDIRERNEEVAARGQKLWTRKEKEIAIVSHNGFLFHTLSAFGNDCHPSVKSETCTNLANCELRSVVIIDRSMIGSDSSTTNYPGKIPSGPDLPSDIASEKHLEEKGA